MCPNFLLKPLKIDSLLSIDVNGIFVHFQARSIVARHIIDRIRERQYLDKIHSVAPRLRSAVELLSKPDADYVYPPFRFVLTQMLEKHPQVYTSVVKTVRK